MSKGIIVSGMQCEGCERIVEKALGDVDGVSSAEADYENNAVRLTISGSPSLDRIVEAVDHAGYRASIPERDESKEDSSDQGSAE